MVAIKGSYMLGWFRDDAPIRAKLMFSSLLNASTVAAASATAIHASGATVTPYVFMACSSVVGVALAANLLMRKLIADPYVSTVVRMEKLAAGDVDTEIQFTHFKDCVGRMTRAMNSFRTAALERRDLEEQAATLLAAQEASRHRQSAIDTAKADDLRAFVRDVEIGFDALSAGDLTVRMDRPVAHEFEPIRTKFNDSVAGLEQAIGSVGQAVGTIRVGLNEITVAASDLSQRTEQQAASLEQTVAALSEVTHGVNSTAGEAVQAQAAAAGALKNAQKGGEIVGRAVDAMNEIEQSSDKIGSIIGVIDEIAFQTNLLALNAGVEAARAGEAGRGFAVVAQEVRGLAQRSAEAAKEIKGLISLSSAQVAQGVELVTASGRSLEEIVSEVGDIVNVVSGIARAAKEQSLTLKEVSAAADQMDKVTQQNAAMVEQTTAASQSLSSETEELAVMMKGFKAGASSTPHANPFVIKKTAAATAPAVRMRSSGSVKAALKPATINDEWAEF